MAFVKALRTPILKHGIPKLKMCVRTFTHQHRTPVLLKSGNIPSMHWSHKSSRNFTRCIVINNSRCASVLCATQNLHQRNGRQVNRGNISSTVQCRRSVSTDPTTESEFNPIQFAQSIFENCHDLTGLPWWAAVVVTTISLRFLLTFPVAIYSKHVAAKAEKLQPEIMARSKQTFIRRYGQRAKAEKWSEERVKKTVFYLSKTHSRELYIRDNCHPAKGFVIIMVQLPLWICLSWSLRNMSGFKFGSSLFSDPGLAVSDFSSGGVLWFQDLCLPDQYLIFPVIFGVLNLLNIEMQALSRGEMMRGQKYMLRFMRLVSIVMVPIASYVPAAMSMYWATSASYSTCQNILLKLPSTRALLGMPSTKMDSDTPFLDMQQTFVQRYIKRGKGGDQGGFDISEMEKQTSEVGVDKSGQQKK